MPIGNEVILRERLAAEKHHKKYSFQNRFRIGSLKSRNIWLELGLIMYG